MSSLAIQSVTGRIVHVGPYSSDHLAHSYSLVEIDTAAGRVDPRNAVAANALDRAIEPGRVVSMAFIQASSGKAKTAIVGVFDHAARRTFSDDQVSSIRSAARKQAIVLSITSIVWLPVAFLLFVLPGFVGLWVLWKSWAAVGAMPTEAEVREAIARLASSASPDAVP